MSDDSSDERTRRKKAAFWLVVKLTLLTSVLALGLSASTTFIHPTPVNHSFTITAVMPGLLAPDATVPMDLSLTNPNDVGLTITKLTARLDAVSGGLGECSLDDFEIDQYSGSKTITVSASSTRSLGDLQVRRAQWPQLTMIDRPVNQDGCRNARLAISFAAEGTEVTG